MSPQDQFEGHGLRELRRGSEAAPFGIKAFDDLGEAEIQQVDPWNVFARFDSAQPSDHLKHLAGLRVRRLPLRAPDLVDSFEELQEARLRKIGAAVERFAGRREKD